MRTKERTSLSKTFHNMIQRCKNPKIHNYASYGGRGIKVCDRWRLPKGEGFRNFIADMGPRPFKMTIERIDTNGNYEPSNCKWATKKDQARNTRKKRMVEFNGKSYHVAELAEKLGIEMKTLYYRIQQGWPIEKIVDPSPQWNNAESQFKAQVKHAELKKTATHCKRGHEFTPENTYNYGGRRACRECRRIWDRAIYHGVKP